MRAARKAAIAPTTSPSAERAIASSRVGDTVSARRAKSAAHHSYITGLNGGTANHSRRKRRRKNGRICRWPLRPTAAAAGAKAPRRSAALRLDHRRRAQLLRHSVTLARAAEEVVIVLRPAGREGFLSTARLSAMMVGRSQPAQAPLLAEESRDDYGRASRRLPRARSRTRSRRPSTGSLPSRRRVSRSAATGRARRSCGSTSPATGLLLLQL